MPNIITIGDYTLSIKKDHFRNVYIGTFSNTTEFKEIYGDSVNEVINQFEKLINYMNKTEGD